MRSGISTDVGGSAPAPYQEYKESLKESEIIGD